MQLTLQLQPGLTQRYKTLRLMNGFLRLDRQRRHGPPQLDSAAGSASSQSAPGPASCRTEPSEAEAGAVSAEQREEALDAAALAHALAKTPEERRAAWGRLTELRAQQRRAV